ncbi:hypothetical protein CVV38_03830 [Candidatus Peregrinibacteria bacterium HGW-Peregrinibacteria-1]|jgi:hypothetical protein|nr:MAG: hypothetical protein CVV38_03830 [Candidatus Peregrinibacteria bacterium HGW-Peregrinibacteria-1]
MNTIENFKKISLILFVITGTLHFTSSIMIANDIWTSTNIIISRSLDIPFILTGIIYGFSSLRLKLTDPNKPHKILDSTYIALTVIILLALIYINIFIPNITPAL